MAQGGTALLLPREAISGLYSAWGIYLPVWFELLLM
jgi:hypothetical protein